MVLAQHLVVSKSVCEANIQDEWRPRPRFTWDDTQVILLWLVVGSSGVRRTEKTYYLIRTRPRQSEGQAINCLRIRAIMATMSRGPPLGSDILHIGTELNVTTPLYRS